LKISRLLTIIAFLAILAMATHMSLDADTWWHLRSGQWMIENRALVTEDSFSYTRAGTPWQYPGLWIQAAMFLVFDTFGPGGLNLWVSLTVVSIFIFVWLTLRGSPLVNSGVILLAAAASAVYWAARPYLVTYLLAAIFFYFLERYYRHGKRTLWLLPLLMVQWVNSHGGFPAGFLVYAPFLVDAFFKWLSAKRQGREHSAEKKKLKQLALVGVLILAATLVNPAGAGLWALPFTTVSRQAEQLFIAEWQSPDFHQAYLQPFGLMLALLVFSLGAARKKFEIYQLLLVTGFGLLGLYSVRNIFFFVIVAPAVLTESLEALISEWKEKLKITLKLELEGQPTKFQSVLNILLLGMFAVVVAGRVAIYLPVESNWEEISQIFPVEAVGYIREEKPEGNLFNAYNHGGYLIWALPEYPVFVDGRADLHQDEIILEWYRTVNAVGNWQAVLDEWEVGVVLLEPEQPLVGELIEQGWHLNYEDELAVVLIKE
jgi:hypothetical protein